MFTTRRDFDCGRFMNEWSVFVVGPNGAHIGDLQFDLKDSAKAERIAADLNRACGFAAAPTPYQGWAR